MDKDQADLKTPTILQNISNSMLSIFGFHEVAHETEDVGIVTLVKADGWHGRQHRETEGWTTVDSTQRNMKGMKQ